MVIRAIIDIKSDEIDRALNNRDDALAHFEGESTDLVECRARLYKSLALQSRGDTELVDAELERMAEILGVEGPDPYFLLDIVRTPQLREMVCHLPGLELFSENLGIQVEHVLSAIGQAEQDRQSTHTKRQVNSV